MSRSASGGAAVTPAERASMVAQSMTEAALLAHVRSLAVDLRLSIYHTHDSRRSEPGFPDLVIVGPGGVLWRELKTERGRLTVPQKAWLARLRAAGQDAEVWRPTALVYERVLREMQGVTA